MMTVMFPTGIRVTYNEANWIEWPQNGSWLLKTKQDGEVIAKIQPTAGVLVEWRNPCTVTAPPVATAKAALQFLVNALNATSITGWEEEVLLRELKLKLTRFDARKKVWR